MRRLTASLLAALLLAGCAAKDQPVVAPKPAATTNAELPLDADPKVPPTVARVTVGTFADEQHGWIIADDTRLLATTDGGRHWSHRATFEQHVYLLHFISATRGWAHTDTGTLTTADGGQTWELAAAGRYPVGVRFLDEQLGWALEQQDGSSPSFLRLTEDGGQTWTQRPTPCQPGLQANTASFIHPQTGFLICGFFQGSGGSSKWLYGTTDGGHYWELLTGTIYGQVPPHFPPGVSVQPGEQSPEGALPTISGAGALVFLGETHGYIFFGNFGPYVGSAYTTADGGNTWKRLPLPGDLSLREVRFFTPTFGRILVNSQDQWAWLETHDGGINWEQIR